MKKLSAFFLALTAPAAMAHEGHGIDPASVFHYLSGPHAGWLFLLVLVAGAGLFAARKLR